MSKEKEVSNEKATEARRDFLKKAAYVAPVVMTMKAVPSLAATGSGANPPVNPPPGGGGSGG